jgi:hypothetical protein
VHQDQFFQFLFFKSKSEKLKTGINLPGFIQQKKISLVTQQVSKRLQNI